MDSLLRFDAEWFLRINALAGSSLDYLFGWTTHLATPALYGIVFLLILIWDDDKDAAARRTLFVAASGMIASGLNHLLRDAVDRARPYAFFRERIISGELEVRTLFNTYLSNSFPSGHATLAFAVAAALHALYGRRLWWAYPAAFVLAMTRVYVGAHFPSDVLAGAVVGTVLGHLTARLIRKFVPKAA